MHKSMARSYGSNFPIFNSPTISKSIDKILFISLSRSRIDEQDKSLINYFVQTTTNTKAVIFLYLTNSSL